MADRPNRITNQNGGQQHKVNQQPLVYNHHKMLKEIRDNLKHLRREPENQTTTENSETEKPVGFSSATNHTTAVLNTQRPKQPRLPPQRNNYIEPRRVLDQMPAVNRAYDESGYSSSSSECSSLSANDMNGTQFVGNMPYYEESIHQSYFSPSNFDFVRALAHNDGFQRMNPNAATVQQRREHTNTMTSNQFPTKLPPSYRVATQGKNNFTGSAEHLQMPTNHTSKVETKYMQKTAHPSGNTTISQAEWKVTTGPDIPRDRSPVPYSRSGPIPEGGARWKTRPYSVAQNPMPAGPSTNQGTFNMNPYNQQPPQPTPQFQVQVSLNTPNLATTNVNPVVPKTPAPSATFRVSVQTSPMNVQNDGQYPTMPQNRATYPGMQPEQSFDYRRESPGAARYESYQPGMTSSHVPVMTSSHGPVMSSSHGGHLVQTFTSSKPRLTQPEPPPYAYRSQHQPDSSQSSFTSYQSTDSDMRSNPPSLNASRDRSYEHSMTNLQQWSRNHEESVDTMSVSSSGSESHSSTIEEESFPEFDQVSVTSQEGSDEGSPVYTNKTGTLVFHVRNRPTLETPERDAPEQASALNGKPDQNRRLTTPEAYKFYMEQRMENVIKARQEREQRRVQLEEEMRKVQLSEEAQSEMRKILNQKESNYIRLKRTKMDRSMFQKLQVIGVGAFGEVCLTRHVQSASLYAMKILKKAEVLKRNQVAHVKAERDILAEADNEWVVKLFYSFQDKEHLYFVMEYVPGGDLMSLLIKYGVFSEDMARFYIAELVLAIDSVHKMGFIHRDIKPDNVLIDSDGHIKLTDFGLCTGFRWTHDSKYYQNGTLPRNHSPAPSFDINDGTWAKERNCKCRCGHTADKKKPLARRHIRQHMRCQAHSLVGTPNYIAPEVLMRVPYTHLCDWWSVGVILYEMLVGQPPFYAANASETQMKVINWETTLQIPSQARLSTEAEDLILRLCNSANQRLGIGGVDDIKNHPFFHGIDWVMIRRTEAYYVPHIRHPEDTSNFDPIEPERPQSEASMTDVDENSPTKPKHPSHAFYEFTFRRFFTKDPARSSVSNYSSWDETENEEAKAPVFV